MKTYFERFTLNISLADAGDMSHCGACDSDIENYLSTNKSIQRQLSAIGPEPIAQELKEYGAWDETELADDEANKARILWIAAGNIKEENNTRKGR